MNEFVQAAKELKERLKAQDLGRDTEFKRNYTKLQELILGPFGEVTLGSSTWNHLDTGDATRMQKLIESKEYKKKLEYYTNLGDGK
jgi:hypothetical protein